VDECVEKRRLPRVGIPDEDDAIHIGSSGA
jgi:hypothetical protein